MDIIDKINNKLNEISYPRKTNLKSTKAKGKVVVIGDMV